VGVRHPLVGPVSAVDLYRHTMPVCQPPKAAAFIVYRLGDTYYVEDCRTGEVLDFGGDVTAAIQHALDNPTSGRTWKETVVLMGDLGDVGSLTVPSYTIIRGVGAKLTPIGTTLFVVSDTKNVEISNLVIDGAGVTTSPDKSLIRGVGTIEDLFIHDLACKNAPGNVVFLEPTSAERIKVERLHIHEPYRKGVSIGQNLTTPTLEHVAVRDIYYYKSGTDYVDYGVVVQACKTITVEDVVAKRKASDQPFTAIFFCQGGKVNHVEAWNCKDFGLIIGRSRDLTVTDVFAKDSTSWGALVLESKEDDVLNIEVRGVTAVNCPLPLRLITSAAKYVADVTISHVYSLDAGYCAIRIEAPYGDMCRIHFSDLLLLNSGKLGVAEEQAGVKIDVAAGRVVNTIMFERVVATDWAGTQMYGMYFKSAGTLDRICVRNSNLEGNATAPFYGLGVVSGLRIRNVRGFVTESSGTATIPSGATSVTFAHGLAGTPTLVVLGPTHAEVVDAVWSADATNITITVPAAVTADRRISWYAEYHP